MKVRTFLLVTIVILLFCACDSSGAHNTNDQIEGGANITREQAIEKITAISAGAGDADVSSIPDMDKIIGDVRYYFIKVSYPSRMSAEYYVNESEGNVFIAIAGEIDISNPLSAESISQGGVDAGTVTEISATEADAVKDIFEVIGMTAQQVEEKFGSGYSKVPVDYNGHMEGFLYSEEGFTAAFGDSGKVAYVYCTDKIDIGGARSGMDFSQIQEKLGKTAFRQTWVETPVNAAYEIEYALGGRSVFFFSRQSDGGNSIMSIR